MVKLVDTWDSKSYEGEPPHVSSSLTGGKYIKLQIGGLYL